ncbi:oligosaccharide repeat unit polymerase [Clostridium perfringens]|uniref:O-antigen polymerase n=1 Tax=Clostridium perfringens TaxID=1502 RepID=UPI0029125D09|nr:O-antigen polymerase [Clostridium perfringens]MDK0622143.1 O-antigen ligase [Clostridium perfringens]MDU5776160.1 O-antigen polymerase [Clostridium perfringens]MDZ5045133.1 oligosaccharide repeat unit polymerase [Clostridium perfringens]MDZ5050737.1 oligosaccharide repeat unit polymerase [Clostridium perfringens]MDZ5059843.1 oligosaccharide repeat unit polymerase [Clostridium perfringens]
MDKLILISVILFIIIIWQITIKKSWYSPQIFMAGIWFVSTFFIWLNPFNVMEISEKTILIIFIGLLFFFIGNKKFFNVTFTIDGKKRFYIKQQNSFNKLFCYGMLLISFCFNLFLLFNVLSLLKNGTSYNNIRDMLFGYNNSISLFSSSFISTFYSWIIVPSTSVILMIFLVNLFVKKLPYLFNILSFINILMYVFATSGRLLMLHAVVFLFFCYKFYDYHIPKKIKRKVIIFGSVLIVALVLITFFRVKDKTAVPSIYSYFCIDIPLLSYWTSYVDANNLVTYGNAFFRGILEGVNFFLGKVDLSTPFFWQMQEMFNIIQNSWIEVFPRNWYNAYVSCFFYFYLDFGIIGVMLGSFVFGKISSIFYNLLIKNKSLLSILIYMIILQCIIDSFIRWQLGTFTFIITIIMAFLSVRKDKREGEI